MVTLQTKNKQGSHPILITHKLDDKGFANAIVTVQQNPNAYKGKDPSLLAAMGLNPDLAKGWNGKAPIIADNHNIDQGLYQQAKDTLQKQTTLMQHQQVLANNKKTLDNLTGQQYVDFKNKLQTYAKQKNIDYTTGKSKVKMKT